MSPGTPLAYLVLSVNNVSGHVFKTCMLLAVFSVNTVRQVHRPNPNPNVSTPLDKFTHRVKTTVTAATTLLDSFRRVLATIRGSP